MGRWPRHLQWQVFPGAGAAIAAAPDAAPPPAVMAQRDLAVVVQRMRPARRADPDGGHDAATKARLLAQSALWRNVYVAESNAQAEDELSALLLQTRAHMMQDR